MTESHLEMLPCDYCDEGNPLANSVDRTTLVCGTCGYNFAGIDYYEEARVVKVVSDIPTINTEVSELTDDQLMFEVKNLGKFQSLFAINRRQTVRLEIARRTRKESK